jgi:hypothetical protein
MFSSCTSRLALVTAVGAVVFAVSAPGASAATTTRYVLPNGSGTECSSAKPCKLEDAVKASAAGDEVVAKPGEYYLWAGLQPPAGITIRGVAGQPRPKFLLEAGQLWLTNTTLRYLEVRHQSGTTSPAISAEGTTLDQVLIRGPFAGDCALSVENSAVRDSVVIARSDGSAICADALQSSNSTFVRNVTAVAGTGVAIEATAIDSTANVAVNVINTIAKTAATGRGFYVAGALGAHAKIVVSHTYYANYIRSGDLGTVFVDDGGNTNAAPLFVNPAEDDYRQKAGSGTIDAGTYNAANGPFDFDGDARSIGKTDIGADEFVPPPSAPPPSPGDPTPPTPPAGGGTPASPVGGFAGVKLISSALTLKRGFVVVKLSCPARTAGRCAGVTKLSARRKRAGSRAAATVKLGRARFSIAAGGRAKLKVRVSRPGQRLFAHRRRLRGRAATAAHDATGLSKTTSSRVTIRKGTR